MAALNILLVEDHDESRHALTRLLHMTGHHVHAAACAVEARQTALGERFDVMLLDLILPDGTGVDLLRDLRMHSAAPAVAMTGMGEQWIATACAEAGFCGQLTKPVVFDELEAAIEAAVRFPAAVPSAPVDLLPHAPS